MKKTYNCNCWSILLAVHITVALSFIFLFTLYFLFLSIPFLSFPSPLQGSEVQFFVIMECVKGKMSDRAIHVRSVPKGTVKFELVLASAVRAVVIAESGSRPEESPGIARLVS